jgi:hypothetical protein
MVYVKCNNPASEVMEYLQKHGIDLFDISANKVRIVCHLHINDVDEARIIDAFAKINKN